MAKTETHALVYWALGMITMYELQLLKFHIRKIIAMKGGYIHGFLKIK